MSMATINRAFNKALAGKASSAGCIMVWERGDDGKQRQRLSCDVTTPNGQTQTLTGLYDGRADITKAAEQLAADFVGGL
jgi:hypothetical protein